MTRNQGDDINAHTSQPLQSLTSSKRIRHPQTVAIIEQKPKVSSASANTIPGTGSCSDWDVNTPTMNTPAISQETMVHPHPMRVAMRSTV